MVQGLNFCALLFEYPLFIGVLRLKIREMACLLVLLFADGLLCFQLQRLFAFKIKLKKLFLLLNNYYFEFLKKLFINKITHFFQFIL